MHGIQNKKKRFFLSLSPSRDSLKLKENDVTENAYLKQYEFESKSFEYVVILILSFLCYISIILYAMH